MFTTLLGRAAKLGSQTHGFVTAIIPVQPNQEDAWFVTAKPTGKGMSSGEDEARQKFLVELEFVQCLANPHYLDWLATQVAAPVAPRLPQMFLLLLVPASHVLPAAAAAHTAAERRACVQGYLLDGKFIRYLDYLHYWKQPQYSKFLVYPHCLRFLDLLQHEEIRKRLTEDRTFHLQLADQQFYHWLYRRRHTQHFEPAKPPSSTPEGAATSAQQPAAAK